MDIHALQENVGVEMKSWAYLKENGYKEGNNRVTESFKQELGDAFLLLMRLSYVTNTDLEKQLTYTEEKLRRDHEEI